MNARCFWFGHSCGDRPADVDWVHDRSGSPVAFSCARRCGYWFAGIGRPWLGAPMAWGLPVFFGGLAGTTFLAPFLVPWTATVAGACGGALLALFSGERPRFRGTRPPGRIEPSWSVRGEPRLRVVKP